MPTRHAFSMCPQKIDCVRRGGVAIRRPQRHALFTTGLILALWSISLPLASCQSSEESVALHFRSGQEALRQGQFARAKEEFKKVLVLDPTLLEAEVNLGLAYHSLFENDVAERHLTKVLHERPNLL